MARAALVITAHSLHLLRLGSRGVRPLEDAPAGDAVSLLARHLRAGDTLLLLTDLADESWQRSALPPLWSTAMRRRLLERRLAQQFGDIVWRSALVAPAGALTPPRLATLLALTQPAAVTPVLQAARAQRLRVAGLWPLAVLLARAAAGSRTEHGRADDAPWLLVLPTPAGLRQVLVQAGLPLFSRLSTLNEAVTAWPDEVLRTAQFLSAQGWLPPGAVLRCRLWLPAGHALDIGPLPRGLVDWQVEDAPASPYGWAMVRHPGRVGQLLPDDDTVAWRSQRLGRAAWATGAAGLLLAALWGGWAQWHVSQVQAAIGRDQASIKAASAQTQRILATAEGNLEQADLAQVAVGGWRRLVQGQPQVRPALDTLTGALADVPALRVQHLAWRAGPLEPPPTGDAAADANAVVPGAPTDSALAACRQPPGPAGDTTAAAVPPAPNADPARTLTLWLAATLPAEMPLREQSQTQQRFEALLRERGWTVDVRRPAVDLGPQQPRAGIVGEGVPGRIELCLHPPSRSS